jgi:hypothetical protein
MLQVHQEKWQTNFHDLIVDPDDYDLTPADHLPLDNYITDEGISLIIKLIMDYEDNNWNNWAPTFPADAVQFYSPPYSNIAKREFGYHLLE